MRKALTAGLVLAFASMPATALAHPNRPGTAETKPMSSPKDDQTFAAHVAEHHRQGIALADAELARGSSDDVKAIAKRIKADQEKDLAMLESHKGQSKNVKPMPKDPDMAQGMAKLKAAKGPEADQLFLELMIAHHASAIGMTHAAMDELDDDELQSMARDMFGKQARDIGELERLRASNRSARR